MPKSLWSIPLQVKNKLFLLRDAKILIEGFCLQAKNKYLHQLQDAMSFWGIRLIPYRDSKKHLRGIPLRFMLLKHSLCWKISF